MTLYAFTSANPLKAAAELREAGYGGFCLMRHDRRRVSRHSKRKEPGGVILALPGYVFAHDPDAWTVSRMRHVRSAVRFCGRWQGIPPKEAEWLLRPPKGIFHDTDIPRYANRPEPPAVKPGDDVSVILACEKIDGEVVRVSQDGHTLMMRLNRLIAGRDTITVPLSMVEAA